MVKDYAKYLKEGSTVTSLYTEENYQEILKKKS